MASLINSPPASRSSGGQEDVVIVVMGCTGTGKSSFINLLIGKDSLIVGNSLESETSSVKTIRYSDPTSGRVVTIVDTPGFDDSRPGVSDTDTLKNIANFLANEYEEKRKLTALVYLQRISDPRVGGQAIHNLRIFREICGQENFKNVVILTTFWDRVYTDEGVAREKQMKAEFFKDFVEGGACFLRHDHTTESATEVLEHVITLAPTNVQIQQEICVEGKTLEDTAAGSVYREEVERIIAKHKAEMAELKSEIDAVKVGNNALRQELQEERIQVQQKLARWENEKSELHAGLAEQKKARELLETDAVEAKKSHEQWRGEQERQWTSKLDDQTKANDSAFRKLEDELEKERNARQQAKVRASAEIARKTGRPSAGYPAPRRTSTVATASRFQYEYTDRYPPYLKNIPKQNQSGVFDIFDFSSLLETASMLFLNTEALPKTRSLAPYEGTIYCMQDLVDRNRDLHTKSRDTLRASRRPECDRDMYSNINIGLRDDWYTDAVYGQQQFTGTNPTSITLASLQWFERFEATALIQQRDDVKKLLEDDPDSLFIQDYSEFRSLMGLSPSAEVLTEGRYGCCSVVLFRLEPEGKLHPLAVILDYKGSMEDSVTILNRRITSEAPGVELEDWPWRYAKMCAQVSDWHLHEVIVHLVRTHLVEEVIIVSAYRSFDCHHIVFKLLEPHWSTTLSLNKAARETLVPKIINKMTGFAPWQTYAFLNAFYNKFDWVGSYVPNDLRKRGFPIENLDELKYHNYGYARNIARMWDILRKFVSTVLTEAYPGGDSQVANDDCLAAFCEDVRSCGRLTSFPDVTTLSGLIDFVTMCIHVASPQHTAVNYLQQYYQTFVPNKPSALYTPLPQTLAELNRLKEVDMLAALPIHQPRDWLVMAQVPYLLSFEVPDEGTIFQYAVTASDASSKSPEVIRHAAGMLRSDLEVFISTVAKYSKALDDQKTPYLVLDPTRTAISILL